MRSAILAGPSNAIWASWWSSLGLTKRARTVRRKVDSEGELRQCRGDLLADHGLDEAGQIGVGAGLAHEGEAAREAEGRQGRMDGVEDVQFQPLMAGDAGDELDSRAVPGGARASETVLDHPLAGRLRAGRWRRR